MSLPWFTHAPSCTHYLVDGKCDCEEVVGYIVDVPDLPPEPEPEPAWIPLSYLALGLALLGLVASS